MREAVGKLLVGLASQQYTTPYHVQWDSQFSL
jgi:hypothetical protein